MQFKGDGSITLDLDTGLVSGELRGVYKFKGKEDGVYLDTEGDHEETFTSRVCTSDCPTNPHAPPLKLRRRRY